MAGTPKRTDIDFEEFRKMLTKERDHLSKVHREQRAEMQEESEDGSGNELSRMSTFDSAENEDTGAFAADYERDELQDENVVQMLHEVNRALDRLAEGTFGLDEVTGEPIPVDRLRAIPWATMTVEHAAEREQ